MPEPKFQFGRRGLITSLLLVALLLRAYVPVGFMPAAGTPFLLELCPAAAPMVMMPGHHHHHHHSGSHADFEHCPFGTAPAAGPVSHIIAFEPAAKVDSQASAAFESLPFAVRLERAHQSRAPPAIA